MEIEKMRQNSRPVIVAVENLAGFVRENMTIEEAEAWFDVLQPLYDSMNALKARVVISDDEIVAAHIGNGSPYRLDDGI